MVVILVNLSEAESKCTVGEVEINLPKGGQVQKGGFRISVWQESCVVFWDFRCLIMVVNGMCGGLFIVKYIRRM